MPECGAKLNGRQAGDDGLVPYCDNCKRYWFDSFSSCVIVMVVNELHEIALLKQSYISDQYETFCRRIIITPGENAEEAATREVKEELGLTVENLIDKREQLMHAYIGIVKKADFSTSSEVDGVSWIPLEDAPTRMFPDRLGNTQHILYRKYLELLRTK